MKENINPTAPPVGIRQGRAWEMMPIIFIFAFVGRLIGIQATGTSIAGPDGSVSGIIIALQSMVALGALYGLIAAGVAIALRQTFHLPSVSVESVASLVAVAAAISSLITALLPSEVLRMPSVQFGRTWLQWTLLTAAVLVASPYFRRLGKRRIALVSLAAGAGGAVGNVTVLAIQQALALSSTGAPPYLGAARETLRWTGLSLAVLCFTHLVPWRQRIAALARISGAAVVAYGVAAVADALTENGVSRLGFSTAIIYSIVGSVGAACVVRLVQSSESSTLSISPPSGLPRLQ